MLPEITYKTLLKKVKFPVYGLPNDEVWYEDGLLFLGGKVLDDRNQDGDTVGKRRLKSPHEKVKLSKVFFSFVDIISSNITIFLDSYGFCFRYIRTKFCKVESFKINKKIAKDTHTVLVVDKVNFLFCINYYPFGKDWAQILMLDGLPWKLMGVSETPISYKRKI